MSDFPKVKASAKLPAVVAVLGVKDHGPCEDGEGSARCPHCGAAGRYVITFICEDGSRRGAMRGCFQLFPASNSPVARLVQEAFERQRDAASARPARALASWWREMVEAADRLERGIDAVEAFRAAVNGAEGRRQAWLRRNGYGSSWGARRGRR